jgi:hypothetical protein
MLHDVGREGHTRFVVERRQYFLERWEEGIAERVRAERHDQAAWVRVLEAVYWWPEREGKEWPALVVPGPEWGGVLPEPDTWVHFEKSLGMDERYRWEPLSGPDDIS